MNNQELVDKRRAVYTGLKPFLPREDLMAALHHWETHYAERPRFTLQRFISDICQDESLRERRSAILLSLVQAMNMPVHSLLPDPLAGQHPQRRDDAGTGGSAASVAAAFSALMEALSSRVPLPQRHSFRLDLLASINRDTWPPALVNAMQRWLGGDNRDRRNASPDETASGTALSVPAVPEALLQALVNRTYVVLAERIGPVSADRALADAVAQVRDTQPELDKHLSQLL
ncbi:hypothetical protein K8B33_00960 [Alcanivorax sp. JB21]|uniref:hypothetical protein n=1 Tax=Alcanivorax limicola TaxID=2874102 RepID=UPI001CBF3879|nr:hypothetical protein [Alcanivorax limicola]MBZ2187653.1 hypothetical protein [Alcanivorax limicola]